MPAAITQTILITLSTSMPEAAAKSGLSEIALVALPVLVLSSQ